MPVVLLDSRPEPQMLSRSCDSVSVDHHAAGELAADHLIASKGFPFNCVERGVRRQANLDRLDGVHRAIRRQGKEVPDGMLRRGDPLENLSSPRFVDSLLRMNSGEQASGLICLDSGAAQMITAALTARDRKIPRDLILVGFDDTSNYTHDPPPITLVQQPIDEIARIAIQTMFDRRGPRSLPERRILLPPTLLLGRSTERPPSRPRRSKG